MGQADLRPRARGLQLTSTWHNNKTSPAPVPVPGAQAASRQMLRKQCRCNNVWHVKEGKEGSHRKDGPQARTLGAARAAYNSVCKCPKTYPTASWKAQHMGSTERLHTNHQPSAEP